MRNEKTQVDKIATSFRHTYKSQNARLNHFCLFKIFDNICCSQPHNELKYLTANELYNFETRTRTGVMDEFTVNWWQHKMKIVKLIQNDQVDKQRDLRRNCQ